MVEVGVVVGVVGTFLGKALCCGVSSWILVLFSVEGLAGLVGF